MYNIAEIWRKFWIIYLIDGVKFFSLHYACYLTVDHMVSEGSLNTFFVDVIWALGVLFLCHFCFINRVCLALQTALILKHIKIMHFLPLWLCKPDSESQCMSYTVRKLDTSLWYLIFQCSLTWELLSILYIIIKR